jgi:uncharacterized phage protein (TIGR01671 family)
MMREFKFRAWDKGRKEMLGKSNLEIVLVGLDDAALLKYYPNKNGGYTPKAPYHLNNKEYSNLTIQQYTGLKDNNGKDIYEGDIVKCDRDYQRKDLIRKVIYREGSFRLATYDNRDICFISWYGNFEIIGNIYENPELLEK